MASLALQARERGAGVVLSGVSGMEDLDHGVVVVFVVTLETGVGAPFGVTRGRLWLGTIHGAVRLDAAAFPFNATPPVVEIGEVRADDRSLPLGPTVSVPPLTARLRLSFTSSASLYPERTCFRFRVEGVEAFVDADALNALAQVDTWPRHVPPTSILTPHPGEMARLCGCTTREVQADRIAMARSMASQWSQVVLLKGAYSVVAAPDGRTVVLPFANPALATAGSGDVLAGAIVGLLSQGLAPFEAAVLGGYLHGLAGELARNDLGKAGTLAGDLLARLPLAIRQLESV